MAADQCPLLGAKRTWSALRCGYDPLVQFRRRQWRLKLPKIQKTGGLPTQKEFLRCVTTASKTSGHDLRRLATSSPHETSEPSHAVSLRPKMLEWRFAFSQEPNMVSCYCKCLLLTQSGHRRLSVCVAKRLLKEYDAAQVANLIVRPQRRYVEKYSQPLNVTDVTHCCAV